MEGKMPPGGTGDLVGRARANLEAGNMALAHGDSLVLSGAIVDEDMIPLREQVAELERHVQEYGGVVLEDGAIVRPAPSAARRERMEQLTRQVGRYSEFIYRYKAALEAGLEPSDDLGTAILMRIAEHEDRVVQSQIRTLQGYLKKGQTEAYGQYEIQQLKDQHRLELQKAIIDNPANNEATIKKARRKYNDIKRRMAERPEPPMLSIMNDGVEQTVAAVRDMIIELDNAVTNYNDARYMTKRLSWPREEQARLRENIDRFGGEFEKAKRHPASAQGGDRPSPQLREAERPLHRLQRRDGHRDDGAGRAGRARRRRRDAPDGGQRRQLPPQAVDPRRLGR